MVHCVNKSRKPVNAAEVPGSDWDAFIPPVFGWGVRFQQCGFPTPPPVCCLFTVLGKIRSAVGSAQLLISKKFQQFRGLCEQNMVSSCISQREAMCDRPPLDRSLSTRWCLTWKRFTLDRFLRCVLFIKAVPVYMGSWR